MDKYDKTIIIAIIIIIIVIVIIHNYFRNIEYFNPIVTTNYGLICKPHSTLDCASNKYIIHGTATTDNRCSHGCPPDNLCDGISATPTCGFGNYRIPGTATTDSECSPCPPDYWCNGFTMCPVCSSTQYSTGSCSNNNKTCHDCADGKQPNAGRTACVNCLVGTAGTDGICLDCESGTYQNLAGQSSCIDCESGTYQNNAGQSSCLTCGRGHYCTNGSRTSHSSCTTDEVMEPGTSTSDTSCTGCARGKHYSLNRCYKNSVCVEAWATLDGHPARTHSMQVVRDNYWKLYDEFHERC